MKALVTGANGFVGSFLMQQLVAKDIQVKCLVLETELLGVLSNIGCRNYLWRSMRQGFIRWTGQRC